MSVSKSSGAQKSRSTKSITEHFINELLATFHARRRKVYCFQELLSTPRKGKSHGFDNSSAGRRERHPDLESRACKISGTRRTTDHLLLVVLITVTLYYELYVGSGVATTCSHN